MIWGDKTFQVEGDDLLFVGLTTADEWSNH
jgi:hypothetical protein